MQQQQCWLMHKKRANCNVFMPNTTLWLWILWHLKEINVFCLYIWKRNFVILINCWDAAAWWLKIFGIIWQGRIICFICIWRRKNLFPRFNLLDKVKCSWRLQSTTTALLRRDASDHDERFFFLWHLVVLSPTKWEIPNRFFGSVEVIEHGILKII
jgi:hypothetical protein